MFLQPSFVWPGGGDDATSPRMLGYLARTLPLLIRARSRRGETLASRLARRVRPSEIDLNLHMNPAAYAQVGEVSRTDWVIRSGAWDRWSEAGVRPVVAEQHIVYRRELKPLQRYELDSRAVGFDGRLLCVETHLVVGDRVHARMEVKLIFVGEGGVLSAEAARDACEGLVTEPLEVEGWRVIEPAAGEAGLASTT